MFYVKCLQFTYIACNTQIENVKCKLYNQILNALLVQMANRYTDTQTNSYCIACQMGYGASQPYKVISIK